MRQEYVAIANASKLPFPHIDLLAFPLDQWQLQALTRKIALFHRCISDPDMEFYQIAIANASISPFPLKRAFIYQPPLFHDALSRRCLEERGCNRSRANLPFSTQQSHCRPVAYPLLQSLSRELLLFHGVPVTIDFTPPKLQSLTRQTSPFPRHDTARYSAVAAGVAIAHA